MIWKGDPAHLQHVFLSAVQVGEEIALDLIAFGEWPVVNSSSD